MSTVFRSENLFGDAFIRTSYANFLSVFVDFIQTFNEDLSRVAANVGDARHGDDGPITTV